MQFHGKILDVYHFPISQFTSRLGNLASNAKVFMSHALGCSGLFRHCHGAHGSVHGRAAVRTLGEAAFRASVNLRAVVKTKPAKQQSEPKSLRF